MKNKRNLLVIGVVVLVLLVAATMLFKITPPQNPLKQSYALSNILDTAIPYKDNSLLFSNGRSFVQYSYRTGKTNLVSPDDITRPLGGVDQISLSDDGTYILFHLSIVNAGTLLDQQLQKDGLDDNAPYWWTYNIATKEYHHFPGDIATVRLVGDKAYGLTISTNNTQSINTYNLSDLTQTASVQIPISNNFLVSDSGFILSNASGNTLLTQDGINSIVLMTSGSIQTMTTDRKTFFYTTGGTIGTYNIASRKSTIVATGANSSYGWGSDNTVLYQTVTGANDHKHIFHIYNATTNTTQTYTLTSKDLPSMLNPQVNLGNGDLLVSNGSTTNYIVGNDLTPVTAPDANYEKQVTVGQDVIDLKYFPDQSAFIMAINNANAAQESQAVYSQLRKDRMNPDLQEIRFALTTPAPATKD